jgi:hypothetical protein
MRVRELQEQLAKFDPDLELLVYTEDDSLLAEGHLFRLLTIDYVDTTEGELVRGDDDVPSMRFGKSDASRAVVTLGVTSSF